MTFLTFVGKIGVGLVCVAILWEHIIPYYIQANKLAYDLKLFTNATITTIEALNKQLQALSKVADQNCRALNLLLKTAGTSPQHPAREDRPGAEKRM